MKALVLAAGEGQRLRPLTNGIAKPMIEVGGKPILQHNVELLARHGFDDIVINLHHFPQTVVDHFGDGSHFRVSITYSHEEVLLGTAGAAKRVSRWIGNEDFLLVYGDNLSTIDLTALMQSHRSASASATIALFYRADVQSSGIVGIDEANRVTRFLEKPSGDQIFSHWVNAGYIMFSPAVLAFIPDKPASDFGRDVLPAMLDAGEPIYGYPMHENLWWIDSHEDYARTQREFIKLLPG